MDYNYWIILIVSILVWFYWIRVEWRTMKEMNEYPHRYPYEELKLTRFGFFLLYSLWMIYLMFV